MAAADDPRLQLHLEPREPIELTELTAALGSLARQHQGFALKEADIRISAPYCQEAVIDKSET
jgi:hypothetical protein